MFTKPSRNNDNSKKTFVNAKVIIVYSHLLLSSNIGNNIESNNVLTIVSFVSNLYTSP